MGLFDLFGKNNKKENNETKAGNAKKSVSTQVAIETIAGIISNNDSEVLKRVKMCLEDTEAYFEEYADAFEERGIDEFDEDAIGEIQWLAMVDILEANQYVCERDWEDELEDFLHFVGELKGVKAKKLPLEQEWVNEDEAVSAWCATIDAKWMSSGMCLAAIDIDSDSYVLFPCENDKCKELGILAEAASYRIDCAKNM